MDRKVSIALIRSDSAMPVPCSSLRARARARAMLILVVAVKRGPKTVAMTSNTGILLKMLQIQWKKVTTKKASLRRQTSRRDSKRKARQTKRLLRRTSAALGTTSR